MSEMNHAEDSEGGEDNITPEFHSIDGLINRPETAPKENHCIEIDDESCKCEKTTQAMSTAAPWEQEDSAKQQRRCDDQSVRPNKSPFKLPSRMLPCYRPVDDAKACLASFTNSQ